MKFTPVLPIGTLVKLTKVASFDPDSKVTVGSVLSGKLKNKTGANKPIELENGSNTNNVASMDKTKGNDYIVNTGSALYFMQVKKV